MTNPPARRDPDTISVGDSVMTDDEICWEVIGIDEWSRRALLDDLDGERRWVSLDELRLMEAEDD